MMTRLFLFWMLRSYSTRTTSVPLSSVYRQNGFSAKFAYSPSRKLFLSSSSSSSSSSKEPKLSSLASSIQASLKGLKNSNNQEVVVVLSVSGGCDSVAMFHACMELSNTLPTETNIQWHVVHFHHRQRGMNADKDCQFVQQLANEYHQVKFHLEDWNMFSKEKETFSQNLARSWRRQRLLEYTEEQLSNNKQALGIIMTAHHKNDSQESVLLKLIRGVHILNLKGIEPISQLSTTSSTNNIWLVRPWLEHPKQDLIQYLRERQMTWREDDSNTSPKYLRNRIRNELVPLLEELTQDNLDKRMENWVKQSQELQRDIQPRILNYYETHVKDGGKTFHWNPIEDEGRHEDLISSQALYQWIQNQIKQSNSSYQLSYDILQSVLEQLYAHPTKLEWSMDLGSHYQLQRKGLVLQVVGSCRNESQDVPCSWNWSMQASKTDLSNTNVSLTIAIPEEYVTNELKFQSVRVQDATNGARFLPPWRQTPIKVRSFLRGQKIPLHERDDSMVLLLEHPDNADPVVVAVHTGDSWTIHKNYNPNTSSLSGKILASLMTESKLK